MPKTIIFEEGDFVTPEPNVNVKDEGREGAYLPSRKTAEDIFSQGPLPVRHVFPVNCTCGSNNGAHQPNCAISRNRHSQMLVLECPDKSQIQCSGARKVKVVPLPATT